MTTFSQEFKDQIVEVHRKGGRTYMELAKEFNLFGHHCLELGPRGGQARCQEGCAATADALAGDGGELDKARIKRLEKGRSRRRACEILGKALAFFARRADR